MLSGKFGSVFSSYENLTAVFKHRDLNVMTFPASLKFSLTNCKWKHSGIWPRFLWGEGARSITGIPFQNSHGNGYIGRL